MTFKQLKQKLEKLTDEQLEQTVYFVPCGASDSSMKSDNELNLEIADFDLYFYDSDDDYSEAGYPAISAEELIQEEGEDAADLIEYTNVKKGMPFFNVDF